MSFVAAVNCTALAAVPLEIMLPPSGTLLFFYFDGRYDTYKTTVGYWDPRTSAGARTVYVNPDEHAPPPACPEGIRPYERVNLAAEPVVTFPGSEHPDLQAAFKAPRTCGRSCAIPMKPAVSRDSHTDPPAPENKRRSFSDWRDLSRAARVRGLRRVRASHWVQLVRARDRNWDTPQRLNHLERGDFEADAGVGSFAGSNLGLHQLAQ